MSDSSLECSPRTLSPRWERRFIDMCRLIASWSKDPSTKVGAVIVDARRVVLGVGYNGFPRGVTDDPAHYDERLVKYKMIVHAEANAVLNSGSSVRGACLVTLKFPCTECAKLLIQSGIAEIYTPAPSGSWADDAVFSTQMLLGAGVVIHEVVV